MTSVETKLAAPITAHMAELVELCRRFHVQKLELFGSGVTPDWDKTHGDLDFLVTFKAKAKAFRNFMGLYHNLEDLFHRRIDLLTVEQLRKPGVIDNINKQRVTIYAA